LNAHCPVKLRLNRHGRHATHDDAGAGTYV